MEAGRGHERQTAAPSGIRTGRQKRRCAPGGQLPDYRGQRGDGGFVPVRESDGPEKAAGADDCGLHLQRPACDGPRSAGGRGYDGPAAGCAAAQSCTDAGRNAGTAARRAICQHCPWVQLCAGHPHGLEAGGLCGDGGGLCRRSGGREVSGHQMPHGRAAPGRGGGGGHGAGPEIPRGCEEGRTGPGESGGAKAGAAQPAAACGKSAAGIRAALRGCSECLPHGHGGGAFAGGGRMRTAGRGGCDQPRMGRGRRRRRGAGPGSGEAVL